MFMEKTFEIFFYFASEDLNKSERGFSPLSFTNMSSLDSREIPNWMLFEVEIS